MLLYYPGLTASPDDGMTFFSGWWGGVSTVNQSSWIVPFLFQSSHFEHSHTHTELSHTFTQLSHVHTCMHTHACTYTHTHTHTHTQSCHTHTHTSVILASQKLRVAIISFQSVQRPLQLYSFVCKTVHFVFKMRKWVVCIYCGGR